MDFRGASPFLSGSISCALRPESASSLSWYLHGYISHAAGLAVVSTVTEGKTEACAN